MPAAIEDPQWFANEKSSGSPGDIVSEFEPGILTLEIVIVDDPAFVSVTVCDAFVLLFWFAKFKLVGKIVRAGVELKFAVTVSGALMVTVVDALLAVATGPVQLVNLKPAFATAATGTTAPEA